MGWAMLLPGLNLPWGPGGVAVALEGWGPATVALEQVLWCCGVVPGLSPTLVCTSRCGRTGSRCVISYRHQGMEPPSLSPQRWPRMSPPCLCMWAGLAHRAVWCQGFWAEMDLKCCVHLGMSQLAATELAGPGRSWHTSWGIFCELLLEPVLAAMPRGWRLQGCPVRPSYDAGGRAAHAGLPIGTC